MNSHRIVWSIVSPKCAIHQITKQVTAAEGVAVHHITTANPLRHFVQDLIPASLILKLIDNVGGSRIAAHHPAESVSVYVDHHLFAIYVVCNKAALEFHLYLLIPLLSEEAFADHSSNLHPHSPGKRSRHDPRIRLIAAA